LVLLVIQDIRDLKDTLATQDILAQEILQDILDLLATRVQERLGTQDTLGIQDRQDIRAIPARETLQAIQAILVILEQVRLVTLAILAHKV